MRRRSGAGGEPIKAPRRKTATRKRRNAQKPTLDRRLSAAVLQEQLDRRTRELNEALEQQTATADVLQAISRSTFDLAEVLNTLLELAACLCEADKGVILRPHGDRSYYPAAIYRHTPEFLESQKGVLFAPGRGGVVGRVLLEGKSVQVPDVFNDPEYVYLEFARLGDFRTSLGVPLLREGSLVGILLLQRAAVRPFTEKQIKLVETFADQALIAIENTRLFEAEQQRTRELTELLEQQTATSEVLQVISSSPGELQPVFEAMLENAVRICDAKFGNIYRWDGDAFNLVATYNTPPALAEARRRSPMRPDPKAPAGRMVATKTVVHIADLAADPGYIEHRVPAIIAGVELGGIRTLVTVPMLKENKLVGALTVYRQEVRPFTDKQIELLTNFAAQAVIAIENARLLNELRQRTIDLTERTADLTEALEQQTATSQVLQVINSSPGDLQPVFATMLENAVRICDAKFGNIYRWDGEALHLVASHNVPPAFADARRRSPRRPSPEAPTGRMIATKMVIYTANLAAEQTYIERDPDTVTSVEVGGVRSLLSVPMLKENELIGGFTLSRHEVRPFTDRQIELVKNFAAQAVIAIENTRLLNELRELLQQQTATAKVLQVISSSTFDLQTVLNALVETGMRLCEADVAAIWRLENGVLELAATSGMSNEFVEFAKQNPIMPGRGTVSGRVVLEGKTVHLPDVLADPEFTGIGYQSSGKYRSNLGVPLLRKGQTIGAFLVARRDVRPFTEKQIKLVETFADQAVIAIENVRLLEAEQQRTRELTELLEQQTATSEVLQVISSSPGDLRPVFATMLKKAVRICAAKFGNIYRWDNVTFDLVATFNTPPALAKARRRSPVRPSPGNLFGRMLATKAAIYVTDLAADERYIEQRDPTAVAGVELGGIRTLIAVPMLKDNELIGALTVFRQEVRPFTDKQIELVKSFAAQAVIAIENARLLNELRQRTTDLTERTADLTEALEQQTATSEVLEVISSSPGDLQPVFATMLENAVRICDATFGNIYRWDGEALHLLAAHNTPPALAEFHRRSALRPALVRRMVETKTATHVADVRTDPEYVERRTPSTVAAVELGGVRSFLSVPMVKENELIGSFSLYRQEVRPFTEKQIALVTSFAAQAVIAIENTRLLSELRESLQQQTATADVLKVISRSTFDLQTVLDTLIELAARLCAADTGGIQMREGDLYRMRAHYGLGREAVQHGLLQPLRLDRSSVTGRVALDGKIIQIPDVLADPEYHTTDHQQAFGYRTILGVPLLRDGTMVGVLSLTRDEVSPFTDKQIELVTTFADQAVIAIENVRLFEAEQQRTRELTELLEQQTATAKVLQVISRSTFDLQAVLNTLTEFGRTALHGGPGCRHAAGWGSISHRLELRLFAGSCAVLRRAPHTAEPR